MVLFYREFIARYLVVGNEDHDLTSYHLKADCKKFMEILESNIGNIKQPLYDGIQPYNIYYLAFDDYIDIDDMVLPYGQDIKDHKTDEVNKEYVESLE